MPGNTDNYQVIYRAIADFASFKKASTEAQAELAKLKKAQKDYDDSVVTGEAKASIARAAAIKVIEAETSAVDRDTKALREHAITAAEDAAATKEDAAARRELAAADAQQARRSTRRNAGGGSASSTAETEATRAATDAKRDATKADQDWSKAEDDLGIKFLTAERALEMASEAAKKREAAERAAVAAVRDSVSAEKESGQATQAKNTVVADAIKTLDRYRLGQIQISQAVRDAEAVVVAHRLGIASDIAAEKDRIRTLSQSSAEQDKNADSGRRLGGVLGLIQSALINVGRESSSSGGGEPPFLKQLGSGIDEVESKIGGFASFLVSGLRFGALLGLITPLIAALQAAGAAVIGFGADIASLGGLALTAAPGLAALLTGALALVIGIKSVTGAFSAYKNVVQAQATANQIGANGLTSYQTSVIALRDAEIQLGNAQQATRDAQVSLNEARVQALRSLQDLQRAVQRGPLDEKAAAAALQVAKEDYLRTFASPTSTIGQREEAQVAVDQAQNNLTDTQTQNTRNQQDLAVAQKKGVEGSDAVVHALEAQANAQQQVVKAYQALAAAQHQVATGSSQVATATAAYNAALAKLDLVARSFVTGLVAQKNVWTALVKVVQRNLFGPIVGDLGRIKSLAGPVSDLLGKSAGAIGKVADQGIKLATSGPFTRDFGTIANQNAKLITTMGSAGLTLLDVLRNLIIAAGPVTQKLADAFLKGSQNLDKLVQSGRDSGKLAAWLDTVYKRAALFWDIIKNIAMSIGNLAGAATDFNNGLLVSLDNITKRWVISTKAQEDNGSKFKKYLDEVKPLLSAMGKFLGDVVREFLKIGADPANIQIATSIFQKLSDLLPSLGTGLTNIAKLQIPAALLDALHEVLDIINSLEQAGFFSLLQDFANGLKLVADGLKGIGDVWQKAQGFFSWLGGPGIAGQANSTAGVFHILADGIHALFIALGLLAGIAIIGKFTGLFKIFETISKVRAGTSILNKIPGLGGLGKSGTVADNGSAALKGSASLLDRAAEALLRAAARLMGAGAAGAAENAVADEEQALGGNGGGGTTEEKAKAKSRGTGTASSRTRAATRTAGTVEGSAANELDNIVNEVGPTGAPIISNAESEAILAGRAGAARGAVSEAERLGGAATGGGRLSKLGGALKGGLSKITGLFGIGGKGAGAAGAAEEGSASAGLLGKAGLAGGIFLGGQIAGGLISGGQTKGARAAAGGIVSDAATGAAVGALFGPIGIGVGALGGAIFGVLTKTPAGKIIGDWFKKSVLPEIKKLPQQLAGIGVALFKLYIWPYQQAWKYIKVGWKAFSDAMETAFKATVHALSVAWNFLVDVVEFPFKEIIKFYQLQWDVLVKIFQLGTVAVQAGLKVGWQLIQALIVQPVQAAVGVIEGVWVKIGGVFVSAKNDLLNTLNVLKAGMQTVWGGITDLFETPIKFVVNQVFNKGIISGINSLTGAIGLGKLLHIPDIKLPFAVGDWVPKSNRSVPGRGNSDSVPAVLTPGEFVIRKAAANVLGSDYLRKLNYADKLEPQQREALTNGRRGYYFGDSVLGAVENAGSTAWNATGGAAIKWTKSQLRKGLAALFQTTIENPLNSLVDSQFGGNKFGLPGNMLNSETHTLLDGAYHWLKGIDNAHDKSQPVNGQVQAKAGGGFIQDLLAGAGLHGPVGIQPAQLPRLNTSHNSTSNSTVNKGVNIEKLEVNYPKPETAGDSITRSVQRANFLAGRGLP